MSWKTTNKAIEVAKDLSPPTLTTIMATSGVANLGSGSRPSTHAGPPRISVDHPQESPPKDVPASGTETSAPSSAKEKATEAMDGAIAYFHKRDDGTVNMRSAYIGVHEMTYTDHGFRTMDERWMDSDNREKSHFHWIHLPANNMEWASVCRSFTSR